MIIPNCIKISLILFIFFPPRRLRRLSFCVGGNQLPARGYQILVLLVRKLLNREVIFYAFDQVKYFIVGFYSDTLKF